MVSLLGPVRVTRAYYHCPHCHSGFAPGDAVMRLPEAALTPAAYEIACLAGALSAYAEAAELVLPKMAGLRLVESTVVRASGPATQGALWIDLADRDADNFKAMHAARDLGHHFLFRGYHDRQIFTGDQPGKAPRRLLSWVRSLSPQAFRDVVVPSRGDRPQWTAHVALAAAPGRISPPAEL